MTRLRYLPLCFALILGSMPARAGDREFQQIVGRLSDAYHKKPMRFMGLVSFAARVAHPEGTSGLRLAIFEDIDPNVGPDPGQFDRFMQRTVGPDFHPFVRVRSKHDGEQTYIYTRDDRGGWDMLVVTLDPSEAVVVKMRLNQEAMRRWVDDPVDHGRHSKNAGIDWDD